MTCERIVYNKETGEQSTAEATVSADEGRSPVDSRGRAGAEDRD